MSRFRSSPARSTAAMSLDVVLHLRDRSRLFHEVARVLSPGGRFLFTDAGVVTGSVSNEEVRKRSVHGYTQFVAAGGTKGRSNRAGFRLIETENRTMSVLKTPAAGWRPCRRIEQNSNRSWALLTSRVSRTISRPLSSCHAGEPCRA